MDRVKLRRTGQVLAPSLFTMGNMACGFYSLLASQHGDFSAAATAVLGGILFDMLDGRVARMVKGESTFGVEFDSLSDFLTFGVAPAYMMYAYTIKDYGLWAFPVSFSFALAGGLRLARFNAVAHEGKGSKSHFQGLPIPAGAGFIASFVLLYDIMEQQKPAHTLGLLMSQVPAFLWLAPYLMVGVAFLMVSSIPYAAFKQAGALKVGDWRVLAVAGVAGALVYFYPANSVFLIFLAYVLSGFLGLVGSRRDEERPDPELPPGGA